jgi:hypothetical protein
MHSAQQMEVWMTTAPSFVEAALTIRCRATRGNQRAPERNRWASERAVALGLRAVAEVIETSVHRRREECES